MTVQRADHVKLIYGRWRTDCFVYHIKGIFRSDPYLAVSSNNLHEVIFNYLLISIRTCLVITVGAVLGTIREPGLETLIGAVAASILYAVLERSNFKLEIS
jgi:hypothetical protein